MAYKPIVFNTDMVKAILEGRKTQTRRLVKDFAGKEKMRLLKPNDYGKYVTKDWREMLPDRGDGKVYCIKVCPPCDPGDILWVRETWHKDAGRYMYRANYAADERFFRNGREVQISWEPPIYMPKEAARIFLQVNTVRPERLQNISEQDAIAEGISRLYDHQSKAEYEDWASKAGRTEKQSEWPWNNYLWHGNFGAHGMGNRMSDAWPYQFSGYEDPRESFSSLWNSTVLLKDWRDKGWDANPWVWVIAFERCEKPEGW